jgi:hypothetical protein
MATWDDVRRIALALPDTTEAPSHGGNTSWRVKDKLFIWERPLRKSDLAALGANAPEGPILGVRVEHEGMKHAMIASDPEVYFTTPHFNGYPAVLVQLEHIKVDALAEIIEDAWLACAPKRAAAAYLAARK